MFLTQRRKEKSLETRQRFAPLASEIFFVHVLFMQSSPNEPTRKRQDRNRFPAGGRRRRNLR